MDFGENFLPLTGWTLTNASIIGDNLVIQAGGSATISFSEIEMSNLLPEAIQVKMDMATFPSRYAPTAYVKIEIEYIDNNWFVASCPIVENRDGFFEAVLQPTISQFDSRFNVGAYNSLSVTISSSAAVTLTTWSMAKALTDYLVQGEVYHGVKITSENGLEITRSDFLARTILNSEEFAMQTGDGSGTAWENALYFDPILGKYIFNGDLTANTINAIAAIITPDLYADKAYIAELTVDRVETGNKVMRYLQNDTTDMNYIKIYEEHIQFITASLVEPQSIVQLTDRYMSPLYWIDELHQAATPEETDYPVMIFEYIEQIKMDIHFVMDPYTGYYSPRIVMGLGDGLTGMSAKAEIYKGQTGLELNYFKSGDGAPRQIILDDLGIKTNSTTWNSTAQIRNIIVTAEEPNVSMGNINDIIFKI